MKNDQDFSQLVVETFRSLNFYLKFLRTPDSDIEDIAQDVYLKAFLAFARFDTNRSFKSWLFSIAKNRCIDFLRKQKKQKDFSNKAFIKEFCETFEENSDKKMTVKDIISKLSEKEQLFIELRFFQEMPYKEIAEITGFSEISIKMKLRRVLIQLKVNLNKELPD